MPLIVGSTVAESSDRVSSDSNRSPRRFVFCRHFAAPRPEDLAQDV